MAIYFKDGQILFDSGQVATDVACCCTVVSDCQCADTSAGPLRNRDDVQVDLNYTPDASGTWVISAWCTLDINGSYVMPGAELVGSSTDCQVTYYRYIDTGPYTIGGQSRYLWVWVEITHRPSISGARGISVRIRSGIINEDLGDGGFDSGFIPPDYVTQPMRGDSAGWNDFDRTWRYFQDEIDTLVGSYRKCPTDAWYLTADTGADSTDGCRWNSGTITVTTL